MIRNASPVPSFGIAPSQCIGLPLWLNNWRGCRDAVAMALDTLPRSVPQALQNFPFSGFWPPHFWQNIIVSSSSSRLSSSKFKNLRSCPIRNSELWTLNFPLSSRFKEYYAGGDRYVQGIYFSIHRYFYQDVAVFGDQTMQARCLRRLGREPWASPIPIGIFSFGFGACADDPDVLLFQFLDKAIQICRFWRP